MALLSIDEELARAEIGPPFASDDQYAGWWSIWCRDCAHELHCPLLMVAARDRTPAEWVLRDQGAINKYTCTEYEASNADEPTVVIDDERS